MTLVRDLASEYDEKRKDVLDLLKANNWDKKAVRQLLEERLELRAKEEDDEEAK